MSAWTEVAMGFYSLLLASPSVDSLRDLDTGEYCLQQETCGALQELVDRVGPNLEKLKLSLSYVYPECKYLRFCS